MGRETLLHLADAPNLSHYFCKPNSDAAWSATPVLAQARSQASGQDPLALFKLYWLPVKTAEQQGQLAVHRLREGFKEERMALINRIRGLLAELGLVFVQGPDALRTGWPP